MGNESHDFLPELGDQEGPQQGPSWSNPAWLTEVVDSSADLTAALDPTQMSSTPHASSRAVALRSGNRALCSASPPNSAAPPLARASDHSAAARCAAGEVVAMLA